MEYKNTNISHKRQTAFTLMELLVAVAISMLAATAVALLTYYSSRSYVGMSNYTEMGMRTQLALDKMSREIRQAHRLTTYSSTNLVFVDVDGKSLQFSYNPDARTLVRESGGNVTTYLTDCDSLEFSIFQHTVKSNSFECYAPTYVGDARVIQVRWVCSRPVLLSKATTEKVHSSKFSLRNR